MVIYVTIVLLMQNEIRLQIWPPKHLPYQSHLKISNIFLPAKAPLIASQSHMKLNWLYFLLSISNSNSIQLLGMHVTCNDMFLLTTFKNSGVFNIMHEQTAMKYIIPIIPFQGKTMLMQWDSDTCYKWIHDTLEKNILVPTFPCAPRIIKKPFEQNKKYQQIQSKQT